ncbi:MAG: hypothetical protein KME08_01060 [Aphanothece sp. CMT-3BRIN-NPC111]|jgi:hypothetical protein|nr:hypothetical protein [Aphanothece sp. CMT-3BRIN-NPC111]
MPIVKIIRAAIRDIQKLSIVPSRKIYEIFRRLSEGDYRHTEFLEGFHSLRRTRLDDVRVIWEGDCGHILIVKAGLRRDVYQDNFADRQRIPAYGWNPEYAEISSTDATQAYVLNREENNAWYSFVYGGYRYSPILTQLQRQVSEDLLQVANNPTADIRSRALLVQSAPGTGKTVCAVLLGCEFHQQYEWNTMLIVPKALCRDIADYSEVKNIRQRNTEGFFIGTFSEWIGEVAPDMRQRIASPEEELQALQNIAERIHLNIGETISYHDVLLYQAFILNDNNHNHDNNPIYKTNERRINILRRIRREWWERELNHRLCRLDAAKELISNAPIITKSAERTILIIDEAQDYLLDELLAVINLCKKWHKQNHPTYLWLLGDLNQRVQPVDFNWGHLELKQTTELVYNYRNSQRILEFANQFLDFARQENLKLGGRHNELPEPAKPENSLEEGELVRLLECSSLDMALEFLRQLAQSSKSEEDDERWLLRKLANQVRVLHNNLDCQYGSFDSLEIINAEQAKGREFEAAVALCLFHGTGTPSLEESFQWYTLLTRTRSRLLVVATTAELERINCDARDYFAYCAPIDFSSAVTWITGVASDVDLTQIIDDVHRYLQTSWETGYLYWDTYLALQLARVEGETLYKWEQEAISILKQHSTEHLCSELEQCQSIALRCLLLRSMNCSWQAVREASQLQEGEPREYVRLLESIARDLENKGLPYEAARVRTRLEQPFPSNYPFPEIGYKSGSLLSLVCETLLSEHF